MLSPVVYRALLAAFCAVAIFAQQIERRVILLLGPPGAGKTTQAQKLKSTLNIPVIAMSDLLRKEGGGKTAMNRALKAQIAGGELVSDEIANSLIRQRITRPDASRGFILDGYPATGKQAEFFDTTLNELGLPRPAVIQLSVPDSIADTRLNQRGRSDDNPGNIERRIVDYRVQAELILARYAGHVVTVDGTKTPDAVADEVRKALAGPQRPQ